MPINTSTKQKLNTRSSTETELVAADNFMPIILWTNYFLEAQGYGHQDTILYQDNQSAILLEKNGCKSSSKRTKHLNCRFHFIANRINTLLSYTNSAHGKPHPLAVDNPSNQELTQCFHTSLSLQIPFNFDISPHPKEILSWVMQVLQTLESSLMQSKKPDTKQPIVSGAGGSTSASVVASTITLSSLTFPNQKITPPPILPTASPWCHLGSHGRLTGQHCKLMVSSTVWYAASHLAVLFWHHHEPSPIHLPHSTLLYPTIRSLFRAFDNVNPPPNHQKSITPRLLHWLYSSFGSNILLL
jgi:hypothetical protein